MTDPAIINEVQMLRAHASEVVSAADNLLKKLSPAKKRSGLSDAQTAKLIAQKNKKRV